MRCLWIMFVTAVCFLFLLKSLYDFGRRCLKIKDVCVDFEPYFKVHNLVSVHPKSVILGQMTNLNMVFHKVVSVYRSVYHFEIRPSSLMNFGTANLPRLQNRGNPKTRKPETGIRNRNPESGIRNPKSGIRNPESGIHPQSVC